jgi:hypothetical protein
MERNVKGIELKAKRPNILFIFTDQQSLRAMGVCGFPARTPNMDALAANPEFANELQRHRRLLTKWQAATKDTFQAASP